MQDNKKIRLIMMQPVYKKHNWPIPIVKEGDRYLTGQNLTLRQMTGEAELTEQQRIMYPVVINPFNLYRAVDRKVYFLDDPNDKAMYDLMLLSGRIALTEAEYKKNRDRFIGYFFDPDQEAIAANYLSDLKFEAESKVRKMSITEYDKVLLALTYKVPAYDFGGSLKGLSPDRKRHEILKACDQYPQEVMNCFADVNPGIDEELFIIELLHNNILLQKQDGSIMYGPAFIGNDLDDVKKYLYKEDNQYLRKKWQLLLDEKKGYVGHGAAEKFSKKNQVYADMTLEELQKFIKNPANKIKWGEFREIMNDREAILNKLDVQYAATTA